MAVRDLRVGDTVGHDMGMIARHDPSEWAELEAERMEVVGPPEFDKDSVSWVYPVRSNQGQTLFVGAGDLRAVRE